jgi:hypothetical protein
MIDLERTFNRSHCSEEMDNQRLLEANPATTKDEDWHLQPAKPLRSGNGKLKTSAYYLSTLLLGVVAGALLNQMISSSSRHPVYSPMTGQVDLSFSKLQLFDGKFGGESIYRQPGSVEVDEAWDALGVVRMRTLVARGHLMILITFR